MRGRSPLLVIRSPLIRIASLSGCSTGKIQEATFVGNDLADPGAHRVGARESVHVPDISDLPLPGPGRSCPVVEGVEYDGDVSREVAAVVHTVSYGHRVPQRRAEMPLRIPRVL